ncbi:hypothetical protein BV25DRAFT_1914760 [Artomyces pyxidatus]|uniref:Uncharacterized protein n=1 Tax=Artomyces pyxidatus TaxID=48021 RepID=A0ACB8T823_9AGAM|nr:hypothetical protein BV25DRAFT_1914760 [Artomyces pyxidatus]
MSTASLSLYSGLYFSRIPSYSAELHPDEHRLVGPALQRPSADFVKHSKSGGLSLRLGAQVEGAATPMFAARTPVEGIVEIAKPEGLAVVAVKIEGRIKLHEFAEGGTMTVVLCNESIPLWRKGEDAGPCPSALPFSTLLPMTFVLEDATYPLPPTFAAQLEGIPGFSANVEYTVTAFTSKTKTVVLGIGETTVSTPFIYRPLTRPTPGLQETAEWRAHESTILMRSPGAEDESIMCKLYVPRSHVYCLARPIPFHIAFVGSATLLPTLLAHMLSPTGEAPSMASTSIQVVRQATVSVKTQSVPTAMTMWHIFSIGEGSIHRTGHGAGWAAFSGELNVNSDETVGDFDAGCLWVKDCIVFTVTPTDAVKGPMKNTRIVIPIRLVTNPFEKEPDELYNQEKPDAK